MEGNPKISNLFLLIYRKAAIYLAIDNQRAVQAQWHHWREQPKAPWKDS